MWPFLSMLFGIFLSRLLPALENWVVIFFTAVTAIVFALDFILGLLGYY